MFRTTVHVTARTAMTAIAGIEKIGRPGAPPHHDPRQQRGQPHEQKDVVDSRGGQVAVQQVVRHPEATARRTVPARQKLERACRKRRSRACVGRRGRCRPGHRRAPRPYRVRRKAVPGPLTVALGALTKGTPLRIANLVGEDQHGVDDAPHHRTDTARDKADDQLRDTEAGVAEVDAPDADKTEQPDELQQTRPRSWTSRTAARRSADGGRTAPRDPCRPADTGRTGRAVDSRAAGAHNREVVAADIAVDVGAEVPRCHRNAAQSWHPACQKPAAC